MYTVPRCIIKIIIRDMLKSLKIPDHLYDQNDTFTCQKLLIKSFNIKQVYFEAKDSVNSYSYMATNL